ncbi:MAG: serine/threonine-protein kinase [Byssovorax sp.]
MELREIGDVGINPLAGTRYTALRLIGGGSSSEVYDAAGPGGLRFAVKVLRTALAGTREAVFRLEQEARVLSSLQHPNLVRVLDVGLTPDGRPFFVMPRLSGETLRQRLRREGPLAPALACSLLGGMLEGLDRAHEQGIVHRDLKPANLFLVARPRVIGGAGRPIVERPVERCVLLDFGIAKHPHMAGDPTTGAHMIGTPRYLAPEQILGGRVDARTDVYAAGLVLFEMVTGESPFDAKDPIDLMHAHLEVAPRRLGQRAHVSWELAHAVGRALEKRPDRRWPSARAFAAVIERAAACELLRAQPGPYDSEPLREVA